MNLTKGKRESIIYLTVFLWIGMGILGALMLANFAHLGVYFLALTGFVSIYIWGESARSSKTTTVFKSGENSRREVMIYITMALWAILGGFGIIGGLSLVQIATYFGALTPFVGAYILGETYKPQKEEAITVEETAAVEVAATTEVKEEAPNYTEEDIDYSQEP